MTISIWGKYKNNPPEVIDHASSVQEAGYLAGEYRMAYGRDWVVWTGRKDGTMPEKKKKRPSYMEYKQQNLSCMEGSAR